MSRFITFVILSAAKAGKLKAKDAEF